MKEKLLLHVCCAPCSIYVINQLLEKFELTVYFFNPNIFPEEEYWQRLAEIKNFCQGRNINYLEEEYRPKSWLNFIKGYENEKERGLRCDLCFLFRLNKSAEYAKFNDFDWFSTTLTMGRQKNSFQVMQAGRKAEDRYRVKFWDQDFKKNFGVQISDWLAKKLGLYRQEYCGCVFSKKI
ncbi:MAG: epoxyqueuosine reductase QueH [Candidatus Parcubacteria bacterium]|nr:epoxyqueuosine reductase QueH [Candidatus Parcubacteria bacterium]